MQDHGQSGEAPPGPAPAAAPFDLNGFFSALASPAQIIATVQQLNHNLEMLQGGLASVDQLNSNLERMGPDIGRLTEALTNFAEHMWPAP